jgi:hypothetical protein
LSAQDSRIRPGGMNTISTDNRKTLYEDRYSWALSRISDLEMQLEDARDVIRRLVDGDAVEWDG